MLHRVKQAVQKKHQQGHYKLALMEHIVLGLQEEVRSMDSWAKDRIKDKIKKEESSSKSKSYKSNWTN